MDLWTALKSLPLSQELVSGEGVVEFVYPLGGSVLRGIQLGAWRSEGCGDTVGVPDAVPPARSDDIQYLSQHYRDITDNRGRMALYNWLHASLVDNGTREYAWVIRTLHDAIRAVGMDLME